VRPEKIAGAPRKKAPARSFFCGKDEKPLFFHAQGGKDSYEKRDLLGMLRFFAGIAFIFFRIPH
jgi:hypothetical protein